MYSFYDILKESDGGAAMIFNNFYLGYLGHGEKGESEQEKREEGDSSG